MSIRLKITAWFGALIALTAILSYILVFSVSNNVMLKNLQDLLAAEVEDNVDEIEFFYSMSEVAKDYDNDAYINYKGGILEIDDDFVAQVSGINTGLYEASTGRLLYGAGFHNTDSDFIGFEDRTVHTAEIKGSKYYVYDAALTGEGLEGLWLRGIVASAEGTVQLNSIQRTSLILLPVLLLVAILGGYMLAGRLLRPIRRIIATASEINRGSDLTKRIDLGEGYDELHQLATAFDGMFDRLEESFESEKRFTSDVSHELRTPMSVITAQCDYTLEKDREPEEYREALTTIRRQAGKLSRMISDMLMFSRLERKSEIYQMTAVDLSGMTEDLCGDLALIEDKGIRLETDVAPDVRVRGNGDLLSRLLNNLVSNAYRYGRENGRILVSLKAQDGRARLSVTDDGVGIPAEEQEKIFRRFYQSDASRSSGGSGLGLAMAREIAQFHGGTLSVESAPGEGSTFTFETACLTDEGKEER